MLTITSIAIFGAWRASAAATPGESTYGPVAPCRLFDTRPVAVIPGSDTTPLGAEETRTQQVTGAVGNCDLPTDASDVAFNITILKPIAQGFLALFPADGVVAHYVELPAPVECARPNGPPTERSSSPPRRAAPTVTEHSCSSPGRTPLPEPASSGASSLQAGSHMLAS